MKLRRLTLTASVADCDLSVAVRQDLSTLPCAFCGVRSGTWQLPRLPDPESDAPPASPAACPLCALSEHLERPRIDDEAALIWLPEVSQQAVNALLREIHLRLRALGEDVAAAARLQGRSSDRAALYYARQALSECSEAASARLGTTRPSELADALQHLPTAAHGRRGHLLGGIRLLPLGRWFDDGADIYPRIVDTWLRLASCPGGKFDRARLWQAETAAPDRPAGAGSSRGRRLFARARSDREGA